MRFGRGKSSKNVEADVEINGRGGIIKIEYYM